MCLQRMYCTIVRRSIIVIQYLVLVPTVPGVWCMVKKLSQTPTIEHRVQQFIVDDKKTFGKDL